MAVKNLLCGFDWEGFSAEYGLHAWAQCSLVRKLPRVIWPSVILMGEIVRWKTQLLSINLRYSAGLGSFGGMLLQKIQEEPLWARDTSDLDGLLETGSSHYRVSAAYERAGFICGARGNVCQLSTWGPWPQSVSLLFGARAQLWFLYQPCWPQGPHLGLLTCVASESKNEIRRIRLKVSKHRGDFRNMVDIRYLARRVLNTFLP